MSPTSLGPLDQQDLAELLEFGGGQVGLDEHLLAGRGDHLERLDRPTGGLRAGLRRKAGRLSAALSAVFLRDGVAFLDGLIFLLVSLGTVKRTPRLRNRPQDALLRLHSLVEG